MLHNPTRKHLLVATLTALGTTGALAQGMSASGQGPLSREEVVADLRAAQATGWEPVQEVSPTPLEAMEMERKSFMRDGSMNGRYGERDRYRDGSIRDDRSGRGDPSMRSPNQDETRSLQNVPNQRVPVTPR